MSSWTGVEDGAECANLTDNLLSDCRVTAREIERLSNAEQSAVLQNCDLQGLDLSQSNMAGWRFEKCNLSGTSFNGSQLERSCFAGCRASGASFVSATLTEAQIDGGDFSNATFRGAVLATMKIARCKMTGADLSETRSIGLELDDVLLVFALLPKISFRKMTLKQIDFGEADLRSCDFRETVFEDCSLRDANLSGCRFEKSDLRGADLGGVRLTDAKQFKGAIISKRQAADLLNQLGLQVH